MMTRRTTVIAGTILVLASVLSILGSAADPPYVMEGAQTEVTFDEDGSHDDLNLYDIFDDDDPEDENLSLSFSQVEGLDISIDQTSGEVNITGEEDWNGQVEAMFRAMDGSGYFADHGITVTVIPVNDPPEALGRIPREIWSEGDVHHFNVSQYFTDVDGDVLYYYAEPEPNAFSFINAENDHRNPLFEIIPDDPMFYGYIQVAFTAYDMDPTDYPDEALSANITAVFEVESVNSRPTVISYSPSASVITINETESINFSIDEVTDPDSHYFKCSWVVDGFVEWGHQDLDFQYPIDPSYTTAGTFNIKAVVMDNLGGKAHNSPTWTLIIENVNRPPTVDLVIERTMVPYGNNITLNATGSDPDGDELTYSWYRLTGDNRTKWIGDGQSFVYEKDLASGRHRFRCEVSDGNDTVTSDWVVVTVDETETPVRIWPFFALFFAASFTLMILAWRSRNNGMDD